MKNIKKLDGSFNIEVNGLPYNTIIGDKYYDQTLKLYTSNPELFELEQENTISLKNLKIQKTQEVRDKIEKIFYTAYPQYKQNNIAIFGTDQEKAEFKVFHDEKANLFNSVVEQIETSITVEEVEAINISKELNS